MVVRSSFAIAALAIAGCAKPRPATLDRATPPPPPPAAETPAAEAPAAPFADLPPFGPSPSADPKAAAVLLDELEGELMEGGPTEEDPELLQRVAAVVRADPAAPRPRVLLASLVEDETVKLSLLEPLAAAADCGACVDAILDLDDQVWSEAVLALKSKVTVSPQRRVLDALRRFHQDGDAVTIAPHFKSKKVRIEPDCFSCEAGGVPSPKPRSLRGAKVVTWLKDLQAEGNLGMLSTWSCSDDCCTTTASLYGEPQGTTFLMSICFAPGTDQVASISTLE